MRNLAKTVALLSLTISSFAFSHGAFARDMEWEAPTFQRIRYKASNKINSFKNKISGRHSASSNSSSGARSRSGYEPSSQRDNSEYSYNEPELEVSSIRGSGQFEAQVDQMVIANWQKPEKISEYSWNRILAGTKRVSKKTGIPQQLIMSLINKESGFNAGIVSRSGAIGLTQIMPVTAQAECGLSRDELFDIDKNLTCGIGYLEKQMRYFGKLDLAVAAYNAGPGAVRRAIEKSGSQDIHEVTSLLKPETAPYVRKILASINYGDDFI